jgi:hypothetical protein
MPVPVVSRAFAALLEYDVDSRLGATEPEAQEDRKHEVIAEPAEITAEPEPFAIDDIEIPDWRTFELTAADFPVRPEPPPERRAAHQAVRALAAHNGGAVAWAPYDATAPTVINWACGGGHPVFSASLAAVRDNGYWCPECHDEAPGLVSVGEAQSRRLLERLLGIPFPKARPAFLRRAAGNGLELDGYNEERKLAFEYQGEQHYRYVPFFHRTPAGWAAQQVRDAEKAAKCSAHKVKLLIIPYYVQLGQHIRHWLEGDGLLERPGARDMKELEPEELAAAQGGVPESDYPPPHEILATMLRPAPAPTQAAPPDAPPDADIEELLAALTA